MVEDIMRSGFSRGRRRCRTEKITKITAWRMTGGYENRYDFATMSLTAFIVARRAFNVWARKISRLVAGVILSHNNDERIWKETIAMMAHTYGCRLRGYVIIIRCSDRQWTLMKRENARMGSHIIMHVMNKGSSRSTVVHLPFFVSYCMGWSRVIALNWR